MTTTSRFSTQTRGQIFDRMVQTMQDQDTALAVTPESLEYKESLAMAEAVRGLHRHNQWTHDQWFVRHADRAALIEALADYGEEPDPATVASGTVTATALGGSTLPAGSRAVVGSTEYETLAEVNFPAVDGLCDEDVLMQSIDTGSDCRLAEGAELTWSSPPAGVQATAEAQDDWTGGDDEQDTESLRARVLKLRRERPAGGRDVDYYFWNTGVDGVATAQVFPLQKGLGTVVCIPLTASKGNVSAALKALVEAAIAANRPLSAKAVYVWTYTDKVQNVALRVKPDTGYEFSSFAAKTVGDDSTTVRVYLNSVEGMAAGQHAFISDWYCREIETVSEDPIYIEVTEALPVAPSNGDAVRPAPKNGQWICDAVAAAFFDLFPGDELVVAEIETGVKNCDGVYDREVDTPAANVTPASDSDKVERVVKGTLEITELA